uniref:Uncharacterized protein n=1 Tax=Romanomermis culicivorax TaxID=13658 RepID=A0A915K2U7_ROMCU
MLSPNGVCNRQYAIQLEDPFSPGIIHLRPPGYSVQDVLHEDESTYESLPVTVLLPGTSQHMVSQFDRSDMKGLCEAQVWMHKNNQ